MNTKQNKPLSRNIGPARISFNIEPGAFGAAYIKAFAALVKACGGRSSGGWVDDKGDHCPFEVRFEAGILCNKHFVRDCGYCDDANPFKLAARAVSQSRQPEEPRRSRSMKVAYVFTVRRECECSPDSLDSEIESFHGMEDEPGEYLFGGAAGEETVTVEMQVSRSGKDSDWNTIHGDPR